MGITKHGLRPVALQSSVVTIVLKNNPPILSPLSEVPGPRLNTFSLLHRAEPSAGRDTRTRRSLACLPTRYRRLLIILFYISVLWTTPGTLVGQDIVRRTHDLQNNIKNYKNCP